MPGSRRSLAAVCAFVLLIIASTHQRAFAQRGGQGLSARWLGQDGQDLISPSPAPAPAPNQVQDIHLQVTGLPPGRQVARARLTGLGGGEWVFNEPGGHWRLEVVQKPGTTVADFYFEVGGPEKGRPWTLTLTLDDGRSAQVQIQGGAADPNLRLASAAMKASWGGQPGADLCGEGPSVGPDGKRDALINLSQLSPRMEVKAITIAGPGAARWTYGTNPEGHNNAELKRNGDDPTRGSLYFQPTGELDRATLALELTYADGKTDKATATAGRVDPDGKVPVSPAPRIEWSSTLKAQWLGQDGTGGPGEVHVALSGLPRGKPVAGVALGGGARASYFTRLNDQASNLWQEPYTLPLRFVPSQDPTRADLFFPPDRDESGATMTLRLAHTDGSHTLATFSGGAGDPALWTDPAPAGETTTTARPGQDLQELLNRFSTVQLSPGTYTLTRPLVITRPVKLVADPGAATLSFNQPADAEPWTAAIKIHCGRVTLEGFAVRFATTVRWKPEISYGPAVIGTTDNLDPPQGRSLPIAGLTFRKLDLHSPPPSGASEWEEAIRLMRLVTARNGVIEENRLRGGTIECNGGPWTITRNRYDGTHPRTFSHGVFSIHYGHDLLIADNVATAVEPAGKTWRFLVLTDSGYRDVVENNQVSGIGPRDTDTIPSMNAPELILTEAYKLHFEGQPSGISADGRLVRLPEPQGEPARTGAAVAVLDGPDAGTWRRVTQTIDARTLVVDPPLKPVPQALSVSTGFVDQTYQGNTIDARGGTVAVNLVLVGNHFGPKVLDNRFLGAGQAFKITSCPSEAPIHWGWSHNPFLSAQISGNTIEDSLRGGFLVVEHGPPVKTSRGRVYFTATFTNNRSVWTRSEPPGRPAFTLGEPPVLDPGEMVLSVQGNTVDGDAGDAQGIAMKVVGARVNGQVIENQGFRLAPSTAPATSSREGQDKPR